MNRSRQRLEGRGNLGTDLRDDHPISFRFDASLHAANDQLVNPAGVMLPMHDEMMRCGTCHDPHDNSLQPFLRLPSENGELCIACHDLHGDNWDWTQGEPPKDNPAYYLRFCKSYDRMGGTMHYAQCDNIDFTHHLLNELTK